MKLSVCNATLVETMAWTDERLEARFDGIDRRFDEVDRRFDEMDRRFGEVDNRLDRLTAEVGDIRGEMGSLRDAMLELHRVLYRGAVGVIVCLVGLIATMLIQGG